MNRPELHDVLRRWRALAAARDGDEPVLVGETYVLDLEQLIPFYGLGEDELHLAFNFLFFHCDLDPAQMRTIVEGVEAMLPDGAWPVWTGSNHDGRRLATRWAGGDPARTRAALMILLGLRGTPFLYYGDEIGLPDTPLDPADALDPVAARLGDPEENRDVCRTPMQWSGRARAAASRRTARGRGCRSATSPRTTSRPSARTRGSILHLVRDLIALRRERADLRGGAYETLPAPAGAWAWRRGERTAVAVNLVRRAGRGRGPGGHASLVGTDRARDGEAGRRRAALAPGEGAVVELARERRRARRAALRGGLAVRLDAAGRSRATPAASTRCSGATR